MLPNSQETADLVTFTEEILNGKLHFLCSDMLVMENQKVMEIKISAICRVIYIVIYAEAPTSKAFLSN